MSSSRYLRASASLVALLVLTVGSASTTVSAAPAQAANGFCGSIRTRADSMQQRLTDRQASVTSLWRQQGEKYTVLTTSQDEKVTGLRRDIDVQRAKNIAEMRKRATTDSARTAVASYAAATAEAIQARRQAVDEARTTFQRAVHAVTDDHHATVSGQIEAFKIGVSDAYGRAEGGCTDGTSPATVRATLRQNLTASAAHFQEERRSDATVGQQITELSRRRQESVTAANETFKQATAAATHDLQRALDH